MIDKQAQDAIAYSQLVKPLKINTKGNYSESPG